MSTALDKALDWKGSPVAIKPAPVECISGRVQWGLALGMGVGWLPFLLGHEVAAQVSRMHRLATGPQPYFVTEHVMLLYVITPLVAVSSFLLFLSPGAMLVLALGQARSAAEWLTLAFGSSLTLLIFVSTGAKLALGTPLTSPVLMTIWMGTALLAWVFLALRLWTGTGLPWPIAQWLDVRRLISILGMSLLGVAALLPKTFWENFNLDGTEAFEFGRSLTNHILPHWEIQGSAFGFYDNFVLFAYPNHWFVTLFGPYEAAARLPYMLYLVVVFAALVLLIENRSVRQLSAMEDGIVWLGLGLYTMVQAYNTNYEPFFADLAEMAATDTLLVACFLSACYFLWKKRFGWFWCFGFMTYLSSPGGLLLLGALAVVTFLTGTPDRRRQLQAIASVIVVCLLFALAHEFVYNPLVLGGAKNQFSAYNLLRRLYPPTLTEFVRFNALLFPSGLLPAISLVAVRRKDPESWAIAGVTLIYFGVLYMQAWTSLHQFTPVMVLPVVVFWRIYLGSPVNRQRWLLPAVAATTLVCIFLSLPRHFQINQAIREFGQATAYRVGDYEGSYERAVQAGWALSVLLPADYRLHYPNQPWGADSHSWIYYATREKPTGTAVNYVVQPSSDPPPPKAKMMMARDGVSVYVRDLESWRRDRERELPRVVQSGLYEPIYRRTFQFFRAYAERAQLKASERGQGSE